jgi:hypothetical protein
VLFVDAGCEVAAAVIHHFFYVWADLLVVTGDVCTFRVVYESVEVFCAIIVYTSVVPASLVTIVRIRLKTVLFNALIGIARRNIHVLG